MKSYYLLIFSIFVYISTKAVAQTGIVIQDSLNLVDKLVAKEDYVVAKAICQRLLPDDSIGHYNEYDRIRLYCAFIRLNRATYNLNSTLSFKRLADSLYTKYPKLQKDKLYGTFLIEIGAYYYLTGSYIEAQKYHHAALNFTLQNFPQNIRLLNHCYYWLGYDYWSQRPNQYALAIQNFRKSLFLSLKDSTSERKDHAFRARLVGQAYYQWQTSPDSVLKYFNLSLRWYNEAGKGNYDSGSYAQIISMLAETYIFLFQVKKADSTLSELNNLIQLEGPFKNWPEAKAQLNRNLGDYYSIINELSQAEFHYRESLNNWRAITSPNSPFFWKRDSSLLHQKLGGLYSITQEYAMAIKENEIFLASLENTARYNDMARTMVNISIFYRYSGQYEKSEQYLAKADKILRLHLPNAPRELSQFILAKAVLATDYLTIGINLDQNTHIAQSSYIEAEKLYLSIYSKEHPYLANLYRHYARFYSLTNNYTEAKGLSKKAIASVMIQNNDQRFSEPTILSYQEFIRCLVIQGEIFFREFQDNHEIANLEKALDFYQQASEWLDQATFSIYTTESKFIQRNSLREIFEDAIEIALTLYEETKDVKYYDLAFIFSEKSKAHHLRENMQEREVRANFGLERKVLNREKSLKQTFIGLQRKLFTADSSSRDEIKNQLLKARNTYEQFLDSLKLLDSTYYQLKYDLQVVDVKDIQELLKDNEVMIEYFLGEEHLYIFAIASNEQKLVRIPIRQQFINDQKSIKQLITNFSESLFTSQQSYLGVSQRLYENLILPIEDVFPDSAELVIIPDGALGILPFEAFVKDSTQAFAENNSFLIQDYVFAYNHSATLHAKYPDTILDNSYQSFLGFFPNHPSLTNIKHNQENFNHSLSGTFWKSHQASKVRFMKEIVGFEGIVHISAHGQMDPNYFYSSLAFSDAFLYAWEIFNLEIQTSLIVLPSCESGSGTVELSEGVMSLARAFAYAGCPAIITSLWRTNTPENLEIILPKFYKELSKGHSKSKALQLAKLDYLKKSFDSDRHPYYWATLISIGDQRSILPEVNTHKKLSGVILMIGAIFLVLGLIFIWLYRKKKSFNNF